MSRGRQRDIMPAAAAPSPQGCQAGKRLNNPSGAPPPLPPGHPHPKKASLAEAGVPAHACAHLLQGCLGRSSARSPAALRPGNIRCGNLGGADNPQRLAAHPAKQELLAPGLISCKCASMWFQSGAPRSLPVLPPGARQGPGAAERGRARSSPDAGPGRRQPPGSPTLRRVPWPVLSWWGGGAQGTSAPCKGRDPAHSKFPLGTRCPERFLLACTPWRG